MKTYYGILENSQGDVLGHKHSASDIFDIIDLMFPIGTVITNASPDFNPNNLYHDTTWVRIKGKVIVGVDENDSDFNTVNKTGGAKTHTLTIEQIPSHAHDGSSNSSGSHNHSISGTANSAGNHNHESSAVGWITGANNWKTSGYTGSVTNWGYDIATGYSGSHSHTLSGGTSNNGEHNHSISISNTGGSQAHNNLQPYITKYVWERIA